MNSRSSDERFSEEERLVVLMVRMGKCAIVTESAVYRNEIASPISAPAAPAAATTIPPSALPTIAAICPAEEDKPEAVVSRSRSTTSGQIAVLAGPENVYRVLSKKTLPATIQQRAEIPCAIPVEK